MFYIEKYLKPSCIFLSGARPGRKILFPPHNDPGANVGHQVTITATDAWTTAEVLESYFM